MEIVKHINDTNASYRALSARNAKNTDLFLDREHYELFKDEGEQITVRFNKENLQKSILFIASILPRKYDNSSIHTTIHFSEMFVLDQLAILDGFFTLGGLQVKTRTQVWNARKDVPQKNGEIDHRFYFNGLLEEISYKSPTGEIKNTKFTIRNYLAGGYSDLHIKKANDGIFDVWITNLLKPYTDGKEEGYEQIDETLQPLQQIFYGAPGTGKSFKIKECTQGDDSVIRTTFHPDSDYSTFVGCYKPTTEATNLLSLQKLNALYPDFKKNAINRPLQRFITKYYNSFQVLTEKEAESVFDTFETPTTITAEVPKVMAAIEELPKNSSIAYSFVAQAFTKAYIQAWKKMCDTSLWTKKATAMPPTCIDATPYERTGKIGNYHDFDYISDKATLKDSEETALLEVDNFDFPFDGINNFGELHDKIKVVVTDLPTDEQNKRYMRNNDITYTAEQIRELFKNYREKHKDINPNIIPILLRRIAEKLKRGLYVPEDFDELAKYDGGNITINVNESNSLLGLYDPTTKTVYLFKKNIGNNVDLLRAVYIHEMFHAYYDSGDKFIPKIEEPIVECNTLCFLELFNPNYCNSYLESVRDEQYTASINYYGFGAHLFENRSLDWMRLYQNAYNHIDDSSTNVNDYKGMFSPIYPFENEEETRNLLYVILKDIHAKASSGFSKADQFLIIEEINRGNCAQIFGDLFQLLDRNKDGYSEYPIVADDDLKKELKDAFKTLKLDATVKQRIDSYYQDNFPSGVADRVLEGELLILPENLFIWATMNTSDQSLFPIDSAFKRRWEWKYIKITEGKDKETKNPLKWKILIEDEDADKVRLYDWWEFLQEINKIIYSSTESADKQMGYFFTKATEHLKGEIVEVIGKNNTRSEQNPAIDIEAEYITAETFVNKVLFYLWTDVMKDNEYEGITKLVQKDDNPKLMFPDFFDETGEYANHENLRFFLDNVMREGERDKWCDVCEIVMEVPESSSEWFKTNSVIFKITDNLNDPNDIYERVKEGWRVKISTEYVYAYATPLKKIVACYKVSEWYKVADGKYGFNGEPIEDVMIGKPVEQIEHIRRQIVFYTNNIKK